MIIKAKYLGTKNFEVKNNKPTVTTLEELLNDKKHFMWDRTNVIIDVSKVEVGWEQNTDDYNFYLLQSFNAVGYDIYREDNEDINIDNFIEWEYVAVLK